MNKHYFFTKTLNRLKIVLNYFFNLDFGFYPQIIEAELTNHCNLECVTCPHKKMTRKKGFMDFNVFKKIIDEVKPYTECINLFGMGESLLHKDFFYFCKYASKNGLLTCLSTNGNLLNKNVSRKLLGCGLDYLIIPLEACKKETYEKIRIKGDFNKLVKNLKYLLSLKSKTKTNTRIILQFICFGENIGELKYLKKLLNKKERKYFQLRLKPYCETFVKRDKIVEHRPCFILWNTMSVTWKGKVNLCCMDYDAIYDLGDIRKNKIKSIWKSSTIKSIRKRHKNFNMGDLKLCKTCGVTEEGYFNKFSILCYSILSWSQIRKLLPLYEKLFLFRRFKSRGSKEK
jgi:radical SAM protein with 4Fe4S-binding SPASM domain